jgi:cyclophilin family peptidyl-prolyl cis-trans isomerase
MKLFGTTSTRCWFAIVVLLGMISQVAANSPQKKPRPKRTPKPRATSSRPVVPPLAPTPPAEPTPPSEPTPSEEPLTVEAMEKLQVVLETAQGNLTLEFYPRSAPQHVRQFINLARIKFFDGMTFSRIIPNFIIQSGNPATWGENNPNSLKRFDIPRLKAEYDANLKHGRGTLSLARPNGEPDGGTTHFFICTKPATSLDGQYTIFGHVIAGETVMDAIAAAPLAEGTVDQPRDRIEIKKVIVQEKPVASEPQP